jgi:hypothetical protein
VFLVAAFGSAVAARAKLETWREESAAAFARGHREQVVISDSGRIRLGQVLGPLGTLDAARVWDLARTADGALYAATGDAGKVFRRESKDHTAWSVVYDAKDTQALALAVLPDGHVVVGTGPSGQMIDLTDPEHPATAPIAASSTSGTSPPTRRATCTPRRDLRDSSGSARPAARGRCCSTHGMPTCSAWRWGPTARSTPAATARA